MNADELIKYWENQPSNLAEQTATTLRQQADRIAELEETIKHAKLFIESTCEDGFVDEVFRPQPIGEVEL